MQIVSQTIAEDHSTDTSTLFAKSESIDTSLLFAESESTDTSTLFAESESTDTSTLFAESESTDTSTLLDSDGLYALGVSHLLGLNEYNPEVLPSLSVDDLSELNILNIDLQFLFCVY